MREISIWLGYLAQLISDSQEDMAIMCGMVNVLKFLTLVACQKGLNKQGRSSLIRVFPVCRSDSNLWIQSLKTNILFENRKKKVFNILELAHEFISESLGVLVIAQNIILVPHYMHKSCSSFESYNRVSDWYWTPLYNMWSHILIQCFCPRHTKKLLTLILCHLFTSDFTQRTMSGRGHNNLSLFKRY